MASRPIAEPADHTDARMYEHRTTKVTFINPPGYEHAHMIHKFGREHAPFASWDRHERDRRHGTEVGGPTAVQGRPVK